MVAFDNVSSIEHDTPNAYQISWNHTIGSGNNRILMIGISCYYQGYTDYCVGSVIVGSTYFPTRLVAKQNGRVMNEVWYLLNPPSGTQAIILTMRNNAYFYGAAGAVSYSDVNQITPQEFVSNSGYNATPLVSINLSGNNEIAFQSLGIDCSPTGGAFNSWNSGQTSRWDQDDPNASIESVVCDKTESISGFRTYTAILSGSRYWAYIGVELEGAGTNQEVTGNLVVDERLTFTAPGGNYINLNGTTGIAWPNIIR